MEKDNFHYEILDEIAVLSEDTKGWTKVINRISYNNKPPVYDIRTWGPEGKMGKGITLNDVAFSKLVETIKNNY